MPTNLLSLLLFLASYTPPDVSLDDRFRFPSQPVAVANLQLARAHRAWLEANPPLSCYRYESWRDAGRDAKWCYDCWDWLNAAQGGEGRGPDYWRYSLRRLRELLGEDVCLPGGADAAAHPSLLLGLAPFILLVRCRRQGLGESAPPLFPSLVASQPSRLVPCRSCYYTGVVAAASWPPVKGFCLVIAPTVPASALADKRFRLAIVDQYEETPDHTLSLDEWADVLLGLFPLMYRERPLPPPVAFAPGSAAKLRIMELRYARGQQLFNRNKDASDLPARLGRAPEPVRSGAHARQPKPDGSDAMAAQGGALRKAVTT